MAELDVITLYNPTSIDFSHGFNGELYTIETRTSKQFTQYVGYHLAKHLATKMVIDDITAADKKSKPTMVSQRTVYDNPYLRIALYKILQDTDLVQKVIMAYPYKGFVGEMVLYDDFVTKEKNKKKVVEEK